MHAQDVLTAQDGFLWTHGTYQFHTLTTKHGEVPPLEGWARMWTDALDNEVRRPYPVTRGYSMKVHISWAARGRTLVPPQPKEKTRLLGLTRVLPPAA